MTVAGRPSFKLQGHNQQEPKFNGRVRSYPCCLFYLYSVDRSHLRVDSSSRSRPTAVRIVSREHRNSLSWYTVFAVVLNNNGS